MAHLEQRIKVGVIGCGAISGIYLKNLTESFSHVVEVVATSDLIMEIAQSKANEFNIKKVLTPDEFYDDKEIELVVCLTNVPAHGYVCKRALLSGKHVFTEKTIAAKLSESCELLKIAEEKNLRLGSAPDTFMGAGIQTCRKLVDDGWIGKPVTAVASMRRIAYDRIPEWIWKDGGGPLHDMGPYYITALVSPITKYCKKDE